MRIRAFEQADTSAVVDLWRDLLSDPAPHNDPRHVIRQQLCEERDLFYVAEEGSTVIGTVMGGYDGHRGWIYALVVTPDHQRQGVASALVRHLEAVLVQRGCMKINLQVRGSNAAVVAFYEKLGYVVEDRVSMGKRTYEGEAGA